MGAARQVPERKTALMKILWVRGGCKVDPLEFV